MKIELFLKRFCISKNHKFKMANINVMDRGPSTLNRCSYNWSTPLFYVHHIFTISFSLCSYVKLLAQKFE